ncbi:MAG: hypothetical protein Q8Q90_03030, partial [bacterium]|nr:hypothetical protein [bacterium]
MAKEKVSLGEEQADWKASENNPEISEVKSETKKIETPEGLLEQIPEEERNVLVELGTKILGKNAVAGIAETIRTQAELWDYTRANAFRTEKTEDVKKVKAVWYAAQFVAVIFAFVHELTSVHEAGAAEIQNHHDSLDAIMKNNIPHLEDGNPVPLEDFTFSQRQAAGMAYSLEKTYETKGGSPADYAIQVEDIWGVQEYFQGINFAYEQSRAEEVAKWGERVVKQYEQERDLSDEEKASLDGAMGKVDDSSALEKTAFKDAALRAIHQTRESGPEALVAVLEDLTAATEFVQTKKFSNHDSGVKVLEGLFENILGGTVVSHENVTTNGRETEVSVSEKQDGGNSAEGGVPHEAKIDYPSNLGIEVPQVHLEFSDKYSPFEQEGIQKYVDHTLETVKAMDHQFKDWQEKYGTMSNFDSFRREVVK